MKNLKCFIMDVDGTLTDGKLYIGSDGEVFKTFNVKDGYVIKNILIENGIEPIIITGRFSKMVEYRAKELDIKEVYQGIKDKTLILEKILEMKNIQISNIAYIGDDLNDLEIMMYIKKNGGLVGCPQNAVKKILDTADFVSEYNGGEGAVRDFIDYILKTN